MSTGPVTRRTTWVAAAAVLVVLGAWTLLIPAALGIRVDDRGVLPTEMLVGALIVGWPHALAAATAIVATAGAASGADGPARLLALVSSGRRGHRDEWGTAMRAELASLTGTQRERLRFAVSCAPTALRRGWGRSPWIVAVACGTLFAALTVATSRESLHGNRSGSLWGVLIGPPQITLLLVGFVAALKGRSMRNGSSTPSPRSSRSWSARSPPRSPRARCGPARQASSSSTATTRPLPSPPARVRTTPCRPR